MGPCRFHVLSTCMSRILQFLECFLEHYRVSLLFRVASKATWPCPCNIDKMQSDYTTPSVIPNTKHKITIYLNMREHLNKSEKANNITYKLYESKSNTNRTPEKAVYYDLNSNE